MHGVSGQCFHRDVRWDWKGDQSGRWKPVRMSSQGPRPAIWRNGPERGGNEHTLKELLWVQSCQGAERAWVALGGVGGGGPHPPAPHPHPGPQSVSPAISGGADQQDGIQSLKL